MTRSAQLFLSYWQVPRYYFYKWFTESNRKWAAYRYRRAWAWWDTWRGAHPSHQMRQTWNTRGSETLEWKRKVTKGERGRVREKEREGEERRVSRAKQETLKDHFKVTGQQIPCEFLRLWHSSNSTRSISVWFRKFHKPKVYITLPKVTPPLSLQWPQQCRLTTGK